MFKELIKSSNLNNDKLHMKTEILVYHTLQKEFQV